MMLPSGGAVIKNLPANAGDSRDVGSIPELGSSPGVGTGNPLQYFCLENPMDGAAWCPWGHKELDATEPPGKPTYIPHFVHPFVTDF